MHCEVPMFFCSPSHLSSIVGMLNSRGHHSMCTCASLKAHTTGLCAGAHWGIKSTLVTGLTLQLAGIGALYGCVCTT